MTVMEQTGAPPVATGAQKSECAPMGIAARWGPWLIRIAVLTVGLGILYQDWLWKQSRHGIEKSADWGHVFLIPLISVYILSQDRARLIKECPRTFWPGVAPLLLGLVCYPFFVAGVSNHFGQGLSLVLCVYGLVLLLVGPRLFQLTFFSVGYLAFAVTVPEMVMNKLTFPLQLLGSKGGYVLLSTIGITTELAGNTLTVYDSAGNAHPMNVAEACSGMRTLVAFIALSVAVGLVGCKHWWQRVVVFSMGIPVALVLNILRIAVLGFLSLYDANLAAGQAHTMIGTVLLAIGFCVFMAIVWALNRIVVEDVSARPC